MYVTRHLFGNNCDTISALTYVSSSSANRNHEITTHAYIESQTCRAAGSQGSPSMQGCRESRFTKHAGLQGVKVHQACRAAGSRGSPSMQGCRESRFTKHAGLQGVEVHQACRAAGSPGSPSMQGCRESRFTKHAGLQGVKVQA